MEEVEIVDIRTEDDLASTWSPFICSDHYQVHNTFFDSMIADMPRRSVEGMRSQLYFCDYITPCELPPLGSVTLEELQEWFRPLIDAEMDSR